MNCRQLCRVAAVSPKWFVHQFLPPQRHSGRDGGTAEQVRLCLFLPTLSVGRQSSQTACVHDGWAADAQRRHLECCEGPPTAAALRPGPGLAAKGDLAAGLPSDHSSFCYSLTLHFVRIGFSSPCVPLPCDEVLPAVVSVSERLGGGGSGHGDLTHIHLLLLLPA